VAANVYGCMYKSWHNKLQAVLQRCVCAQRVAAAPRSYITALRPCKTHRAALMHLHLPSSLVCKQHGAAGCTAEHALAAAQQQQHSSSTPVQQHSTARPCNSTAAAHQCSMQQQTPAPRLIPMAPRRWPAMPPYVLWFTAPKTTCLALSLPLPCGRTTWPDGQEPAPCSTK
jgi:hypothetical protein